MDIGKVPLDELRTDCNNEIVSIYDANFGNYVVVHKKDSAFDSFTCMGNGYDSSGIQRVVRTPCYRYKTMERFLRDGWVLEQQHPSIVKVSKPDTGHAVLLHYYNFGMKLDHAQLNHGKLYLESFCCIEEE